MEVNIQKRNVNSVSKTITFIFGFFENMIICGTVYGWPSLVHVLESEGMFYKEYCSGSNSSAIRPSNVSNNSSHVIKRCDSQDAIFSTIYTVATALMILSLFPGGLIFDKFGNRILRPISWLILTTGFLLVGFSNKDFPWLLFPGITLCAVGGMNIYVSNFQIGNLCAGSMATGIIVILSAAFDSSIGIFTLVKILYENGINFKYCFVFLAIYGSLSQLILTVILLPSFKIMPKPTAYEKEMDTSTKDSVKSAKSSFLSVKYLIFVLSFCLLYIFFNFTLGFMEIWITFTMNNDEKSVASMLNVFGLILVSGALVGPLLCIILILESKRLKKRENFGLMSHDPFRHTGLPFFFTTCFGIAAAVLYLIGGTVCLYVQLVLICLFRGFLFGLTSAYVYVAFPFHHFGKIYACNAILAGISMNINHGFLKLALGPPRNFETVKTW